MLLKSEFDGLKEFLNNWKKDLIKIIASEVSLQIVGESYYKWDSTSRYYPTLIIIFKEMNTEQKARRKKKSNQNTYKKD